MNIFDSVKMFRPKNNVFDLSHDVKLSCNMGKLIPIMCTDTVPGDKIKLSAEAMIRMAPMVAPVMHRVDVTMHYFFVPNRIVWPEWEAFITNGGTEVGGLPPAPPTVSVNRDVYTPLHDYMGIPRPPADGPLITHEISAIPFAAYQKIYDEYYRDQNLILSDWSPLTPGSNDARVAQIVPLRDRCWEHDYFTAALPFAQKGAAVQLPLGNVELNPDWAAGGPGTLPIFAQEDGSPAFSGGIVTNTFPAADIEDSTGNPVAYDPKGSLNVQPTTINDLRRAEALQKWLEKNARGGTRYVENILMHFGVKSSDKRLQRPEYITGVKTPMQISEVLNTSATASEPQGNMSGHGIAIVNGNKGSYYCEEHGYVIGIMSVMPKTAYQQGIPRHFSRLSDPTQYFWPDFANIGEQEILNKELFAFATVGTEDTFGYIPRYSEYKYENNRVAGDFRTTLDFWHMGRIFETPPQLNDVFVKANPTNRIYAVTDPNVDHLWCHVYNKVKAVRPMPKYGTPTL